MSDLTDLVETLGTAGIYSPNEGDPGSFVDDLVAPLVSGGVAPTGAAAPPNPAKNLGTDWWAAHGGEVKLVAGLAVVLLVLGAGAVYLGPSLLVLSKG